MRLKTVMSKIKAYTLIVGASSMRLETVVRKVKAYTLTLKARSKRLETVVGKVRTYALTFGILTASPPRASPPKLIERHVEGGLLHT